MTTLILAGAAEAQANSSDPAVLTFNVNLNLTNLHPMITLAEARCSAPEVNSGSPGRAVALVNHGFVGEVTFELLLLPETLFNRPDHTITVICELWFLRYVGPTQEWASAVASTTGPVPVTDANWMVVAAGSTIKWSQKVTFPNAAAP